MRKLDEKREVLYVIRAMDVLMSSGIGLKQLFTAYLKVDTVSYLRFQNMMEKYERPPACKGDQSPHG